MRRHPFLVTLAGLLLVILALLAWLVAGFDLDSYRTELQDSLSAALNRPVRLGRIQLSLRHGPALDVHDVQVGAGEQTSGLQIRHLYLRLDLGALLHRRIHTRHLLLEQPVLTLVRSAPSPPERSSPHSPAIDPQLMERLGFSDCTLRNGRLLLIDRTQPEKPRTIAVEELSGRLSDLAPGQQGLLQLKGKITFEDRQAGFDLSGELTPGSSFPFWRNARCNLHLKLLGLPAAWFSPTLSPRPDRWGLDGTTDVTASLSGQPAAGLDIELAIAGQQLTLVSPNGRSTAPLFSTLDLRTRWTEEETASRFDPLTLDLGGNQLQGHLTLERSSQKAGTTIQAVLEGTDLPVPTWDELWPGGADANLNVLRDRLSGGRIHNLKVSFERQDSGSPRPATADLSLSAELRGLRLALDSIGVVDNLGCRVQLTPETLAVEEGHGDLAGNELRFSGKFPLTSRGSPEFSGDIDGEFGAGWLGSRMTANLPSDLKLAGTLPVHCSVSGSLSRPLIDLKADLGQLELGFKDLLNKPAGQPGEVFLSGEVAGGQLSLNYGRLRLPPLELMADGVIGLGPPYAFHLDLRLAPLKLGGLPQRVPVLEKLDPRGQVSGEFHLGGDPKQLGDLSGKLNLNGAGLHLGGFMADLNDLGGSLKFNRHKASFAGLTGRIGQSPFTASGNFSDLAAPQGTVHLQARAIRADELIFHSDKAYLRDLDAHLEIAPDRLQFAPVTTRLEGGTKAEVRGSVSHFKGPVAVTLDIDADYGNIDEVIGLWQRSADAPPLVIPPHHGPPPALLIRARATRGEIGGMNFRDASGEISLVGETLVIHPLRAKIGPGSVNGQVLVDHSVGSPPLLRISGHVEGIAAEAVHQQLLKQSSLVKGKLRGDFYLQGRAGSEFLPTSLGGFSLEISDGVLRQFKFLSKVFSLLNVSQILTLKLPDMDREGMPFDKLSGTCRLDNGVLSSEDLFVESNAMNLSLVGKLDLSRHQVDAVMGVKPLRTVDKIITKIPLAGWVLAGDQKALITAQFTIKGPTTDPEVEPIPISSLSGQVLGIFRRVLGLPGKVVEDVGGILQGGK